MILGLFDQVLSSGTNFLVTVLISRRLNLDQLGSFGLALVVYAAVNGVAKGATSEVLVVRRSGSSKLLQNVDVSGALGTSLFIGVCAGVVSAVVGAAVGGDVGSALAVLGLGLPVLVAQDTCRFALMMKRRPGGALASDCTWLVVSVLLILLLPTAKMGPGAAIACWVGGAAPALAVAVLALGVRPALSGCAEFYRRSRALSNRFVAEFALISVSTVATSSLIVAFGGLQGAGKYRIALTAMGPFNTLIQGLVLVFTPQMARASSAYGVRRIAHRLGGVALASATLWFVVLAMSPDSLGDRVFGANWTASRSVVLLTVVGYLPLSAAFAASAGLRALGQAAASLRARAATVPMLLLAMVLGGSLARANGLLVAAAMASVVSTLAWWVAFERTVERLEATARLAQRTTLRSAYRT